MNDDAESDSPRMVRSPEGRLRRWIAVAATLLVVAGIIGIPVFQSWQERAARAAKRGPWRGAVYEVDIGKTPYRMELGWAGNQLLVAMTPGLPEGSLVRVSGKFGEETLALNPKAKTPVYGPTQAVMSPYGHHRVTVTVECPGKPAWSDTEWAWGVPVFEH